MQEGKGENTMRTAKKYYYNPTKPHHFILAVLLGVAVVIGCTYLTIYMAYFLGTI